MCGAWCSVTNTSHVKWQSCFILSMCVDDAIQLNTYGFHKICSVIYASYTECSVSVWSRVHCDCSNVHRVFVVMDIFFFILVCFISNSMRHLTFMKLKIDSKVNLDVGMWYMNEWMYSCPDMPYHLQWPTSIMLHNVRNLNMTLV